MVSKLGIKNINRQTLNFFKSLPPLDIKKSGLEWNKYRNWTLGIGSEQFYDKAGYVERFREKYSKFKSDAINKINKSELDSYIFAVTKFGWINCDKFWDTEDEKIDLIVENKLPKDSKIILIFDSIKSIVNASFEQKQFVFRNIPINKSIKVIGIRFENKKPSLSMINTNTNNEKIELNGFKEFTIEELEKELNQLN